MKKLTVRKIFQLCSILSLLVCVGWSVYAYQRGLFTSPEALQTYIAGFGIMGGMVFTLFQAIQVVIPILPGGLGCLGGVLLFGPWLGFLYNYVGICVGSLAAFFIARNFGKPILYTMFKEKTITRYETWTGNDSRFTKWFAAAIFFPVAPDDMLCYLAGTTQMSWKKFTTVILLGKPASIALYSLGLNVLFTRIAAWLG